MNADAVQAVKSARVIHDVNAADAQGCAARKCQQAASVDYTQILAHEDSSSRLQRLMSAHTIRCATDGREIAHVIQAFHDGEYPEGPRSSNLHAKTGTLSLLSPLRQSGQAAVSERTQPTEPAMCKL